MSQLQISFPKSQEDHRLQLVDINGSIFAIVYSPLKSLGPINLNCEDWSLILLAPIESHVDISISAINIICLNDISSEEGQVSLQASNQLMTFTSLPSHYMLKARDTHQFTEDPGALIHYHRLLNSLVSSVHLETPFSFPEIQKHFLSTLCTLADKAKGKQKDLTFEQTLKFWNISYQEASVLTE